MKELMSITVVENDAGEIELMVSPDHVDGGHFDQLVQAISSVREQFQPQPPVQPPEHLSQIPVVSGAAVFLGEVFPHGKVIGLRHPLLGWVAFQVAQEFLDALAANKSSSEAPPPVPRH